MDAKVHHSGAKTVQVASYIVTNIFYNSYASVIYNMQLLNFEIGPSAPKLAETFLKEYP